MSELGKVDSYDELRPANIYDVAANETWLEDQSAQGWHLTGFSGWSGLFARGEPKHCRYRMQPLPKKENGGIPGDGLDVCCHAPRHLPCLAVRRPRGAGAGHGPGGPGPGLWLPEAEDGPGPRVESAGVGGSDILPVGGELGLRHAAAGHPGGICPRGADGAAAGRGAVCGGDGVRGPGDAPPAAVAAGGHSPKAAPALPAAEMAGPVSVWCVDRHPPNGWDGGDTHSVPKAGVVYVDLRDLEGAEQTEFWSCRTKVLELCPRMYETRQLSLGEAEGPLQPGDSYPVISSAETTHYRLLTEGLARRLVKELSRGRIASLGVYGHPALTAAETDSLDELWWGEDRYYQFVLARLGRQVLFLRYEGETDLWQAEAYFASLLKK